MGRETLSRNARSALSNGLGGGFIDQNEQFIDPKLLGGFSDLLMQRERRVLLTLSSCREPQCGACRGFL